jgi:hypothetical protein
MIKKCKILFASILIFSCKDSIPDPEQVTLINPENNNTCLFSNSNSNSGDVEFRWTEAKHTDNYDLIIQNQITNLKNSRVTKETFARVTLERGAPYSWYVVSKSKSNENIALSETRNFYLEGPSQLTHTPFPAKLISPLNGSIINLGDIVTFQWEGYDLDGDIENYDLIIENTSDGEEIKNEKIINQNFEIELQKGNIYLWKIITRDKENNLSSSITSNFELVN